MKKVFVLGGINVDIVLGVLSFPVPGQTIKGNSLYVNPGGKGANQAVAVVRQGVDVFMIGKVGRDDFALRALSIMKDGGVHTEYVYTSEQEMTGTALIFVSKNGENMIGFYPGATQTLAIQEIDTALESACPGDILLSSMEPKPEIVFHTLKQAKKNGMITILNPAPASPISSDIYPVLDFITPNESECKELTGGEELKSIDEVFDVAKRLHEMGVKHVVITLGQSGCVLVSEEHNMQVPAFDIEKVIDTTAAGDAFNGMLAAALAKEMEIADCLRFANAAGALCATKIGAQDSLPYQRDVEQFLKEKAKDG